MSKFFWLLAVLCAFGTACGGKTDVSPVVGMMPEYVAMAESLTSLIANEIGCISGPPTPGALVSHPCFQMVCGFNERGAVEVRKSALGCNTDYGALDGSSFFLIGNIPELTGCSTGSGPAAFRSWPPSQGHIQLAIGQRDLAGAIAHEQLPSSPPTLTLDRIETGHCSRGTALPCMIRNWGSVTLSFNGSPNVSVEVSHRAQLLDIRANGAAVLRRLKHKKRYDDPATSALGANTELGHYELTSQPGLTLRMESFYDFSPRVFTGSYKMTDRISGAETTISLENVIYRKDLCCHPIAGMMTISTTLKEIDTTYIVKFSEICGEITLSDPLGRPKAGKLAGCSS